MAVTHPVIQASQNTWFLQLTLHEGHCEDTEDLSGDKELSSVVVLEPMAEDMPEDLNGSDEEVMEDSAEGLASTDNW